MSPKVLSQLAIILMALSIWVIFFGAIAQTKNMKQPTFETAVNSSVTVYIEKGDKAGEGSGYFVSKEGYIITNDHVVGTATDIIVGFSDGTYSKGTLIGTDDMADIAVIKVAKTRDFEVIKWGDSSNVKIGDQIYVIGAPFENEFSMTSGIVSKTNKKLHDMYPALYGFIQIDAPLNPGNSGGPVFNTKLEVIGMSDAIATTKAKQSAGLGYAIPSNFVRQTADRLIAGEKIEHSLFRIAPDQNYDNVDIDTFVPNGVIVQKILDISNFYLSGIVEGDVIVAINDQPIKYLYQFTEPVFNSPVETKFKFEIRRSPRWTKDGYVYKVFYAQTDSLPKS